MNLNYSEFLNAHGLNVQINYKTKYLCVIPVKQ